jgi:hypothetical protein
MTSPRYGSLAARTECNHCGAPLPLDAPALEVTCAQCSGRVSVPAETWGAMLTELDEQIDQLGEGQGRTANTVIGGQKLVYEIKREMPHCEKCGTALEIAAWRVGTSRNLACTQCGDPASTEPAPSWLSQTAPNARQLYRVDPAPGLGGSSGVALPLPAAPQPIALACPSCGAGLHITVENPRLTPCEFCGADVYLPDPVWHQLHPVKVVTPFYVRFEGQTHGERRQLEEAERAKLKEREEAERAKLEELRRFMKRYNDDFRLSPSSPELPIAALTTLASPFGGYILGSTYDWPWVTALGLFLLCITWFFNAVARNVARYVRSPFLPALRELMARQGYAVDVVKQTAQAELSTTLADALLKVVDELAELDGAQARASAQKRA